jgi:hypothetical protein
MDLTISLSRRNKKPAQPSQAERADVTHYKLIMYFDNDASMNRRIFVALAINTQVITLLFLYYCSA